MEKINVHMSQDKYHEIQAILLNFYVAEDDDAKAAKIFSVYKALGDWSYDEEAK